MKYELISIYRAERYSPNSVERDKAIMDAVCEKLGTRYTIYKTREEDIETEGMPLMQRLAEAHLPHCSAPLLVLSMARSRKVLDILTQMEDEGARVINRPQPVLNATRSAIDRMMRENDIPCAPLHGDHGWWIKRGDEAAQEKGDVRFAADEKERDIITEEFRKRGITDSTRRRRPREILRCGRNGILPHHLPYGWRILKVRRREAQRHITPHALQHCRHA